MPDPRHPAVLAKEAATMDVLSDGRFELGVGTGSQPADNERTGLPLDAPRVRVERFEELLQIPPHVAHGVEVLEDAHVIDVFSPVRQDWIDGTDTYFRR